jgi:TPR repeat protein
MSILSSPDTKTEEEFHMITMKRMKANDPVAIERMGIKHYEEGDYDKSFDYWTKAADVGDAIAHYDLSFLSI